MIALRPHRLCFALAATLSVGPLALAQSDDPLAWVPADAEFVAFVDWRGVVDAPIVRQTLEKEVTPEELEAQMSVVKNLTGTNLMTDLDRAVVWGRIGDDDSVVMLVEGRFDPEKLVTIVKAAGNYTTVDSGGVTFHQWHDKKENKDKVGAFLTPTTLAISSTQQQIEAARAASSSGTGFRTSPLAALVPPRGEATAFVLLSKPDRVLPMDQMKDTLGARAALATFTFEPEALRIGATIFTNDQAAADKWIQMAEGGRALLQLQGENPTAALLASDIVITRAANNAAVANLTLPNNLLLELVDMKD